MKQSTYETLYTEIQFLNTIMKTIKSYSNYLNNLDAPRY